MRWPYKIVLFFFVSLVLLSVYFYCLDWFGLDPKCPDELEMNCGYSEINQIHTDIVYLYTIIQIPPFSVADFVV